MTEQEFAEWFSANYPKDTIIHDPMWHASRIYRRAQLAAPAPCAPAGWKLVPIEPTEAMRDVAEKSVPQVFSMGDEYRAMVAAAPAPSAPVAVFDGYMDGGTAVIQWRGKGLPAGTLLYAAPVAAPADRIAELEEEAQESVRVIVRMSARIAELERLGTPTEAVAALRDLLVWAEDAEVQIEGEWGGGRSLAQLEAKGMLSAEIVRARNALKIFP